MFRGWGAVPVVVRLHSLIEIHWVLFCNGGGGGEQPPLRCERCSKINYLRSITVIQRTHK